MKIIFGLIVVIASMFLGYLLLQMGGTTSQGQKAPVNNVSVIEGQQIVEITAKGGYR
jgi:hypothetical protein